MHRDNSDYPYFTKLLVKKGVKKGVKRVGGIPFFHLSSPWKSEKRSAGEEGCFVLNISLFSLYLYLYIPYFTYCKQGVCMCPCIGSI